MNILYIDIDSLRPDHLGCYGYHRATSPNIDRIASEGVRWNNCYTPDAPCLPSRTAMTTGRFGIRTGAVNHGGVASQPFPWGADRGFRCNLTADNWVEMFRKNGYHTAAFSPFAQRHGAWHWYAGFMEMHNTGGGGHETADAISPQVTKWIEQRAEGGSDQPFFLWVNVWDPHTPYRTPLSEGEPFADDPLPEWLNEEVRKEHWGKCGPHSAQEVNGFTSEPEGMFGPNGLAAKNPAISKRQPDQIDSMEQVRRMFDGYDTGVRFADEHVGRIVDALKAAGLYEDTAIIISSDHGENLGELWVYGDHQTADHITCHVPMILRFPGKTDVAAGQAEEGLAYSLDAAATVLDWCGLPVPESWDGKPFQPEGRSSLVLSQVAWCAQRAARWDKYLYIHTYHDGFHDYPDEMVFDLEADPHEQHDLAPQQPELVAEGRRILENWKAEAMARSRTGIDPLDTVMQEGGPFHIRGAGKPYLSRLLHTGRGEAAGRLAFKHGLTVPSQF